MTVLLVLVLLKGSSGGPFSNNRTRYYPPAQYTPVEAVVPEWQVNNQALITVTLPEDAKLTVDDRATTSTSAARAFATPALEKGLEYSYTLKAEAVRDGKKLTANKVVTVRAGEETRVTLGFEGAKVAKK